MPKRTATEQIPEYLRPYIVKQDPSLYTAQDHAAWRYILKIAREFFKEHAHELYRNGLEATGISTERIPLISEMDDKLKRFGWRAVPVSGFIPPAVFMEFLSRGVLPIACDMRKIENLAYTPAPDIVHEAAGHAPIIADPAYAEYLRNYGELAEKAIFSAQDMEVYNAVRDLSDTKENPASTPEDVARAQQRLDEATAAVDYVSEATELGRMGWWTIEYGLLGDPKSPKIYGAGLLSSVGESFHCLGPHVKKVPFSVDCVHTSYDITKPQPQLFVAKDFSELTAGLQALAETMAFRLGGSAGLARATKAKTVTTAELDSGIQISGILREFLVHGSGNQPAYLQYTGPSQLSYRGQELPDQGPKYHSQGFGSPVGLLKDGRKPQDLTDEDFKRGRLEYASGVVVEGRFVNAIRKEGRALVAIFDRCTVRREGEVLFKPEWGNYDMACGASVPSVFGWAADRKAYLEATGGFDQPPGTPKTNLTPANRALNELYARVRIIREKGQANLTTDFLESELRSVQSILDRDYPQDWLLRYELLELDAAWELRSPWAARVLGRLDSISQTSRELGETIHRGLDLLGAPV